MCPSSIVDVIELILEKGAEESKVVVSMIFG
jgi:hypothetical protein